MRQVRNQTVQKVGSLEKDPNKHYVLVEKESKRVPDYVSPLDSMLDNGYSVASEDRKVTGSSNMVLLEIDKAIHQERQKALEDAARENAKENPKDTQPGEWAKTEVGAMSLTQLEASIPKTQ